MTAPQFIHPGSSNGFLEDTKMNRVVTLSIALFVAMVGLSLVSSEASACRLFHWGGHHGCCNNCAPVSHDCGGCDQGCGHHGGCASDCGGCVEGGTVIQEQGGAKEADVPEAPPAAEPKETSIRSNRFFRTASFRR